MRTSNTEEQVRQGRYADIMLDSAFKHAFKESKDAKRLMQLLLQALIPDRTISKISFGPEENINQTIDGKNVLMDVECTDENGQRFNVEIQRCKQYDFYDRAVFNSTFSVQRQLRKGEDRYTFAPVYFIGLMRFSLHPDETKVLYRYSIMEEESKESMTDNLHYIYLEVAKCRDAPDASYVEKIGYMLNNLHLFEDRPEGFEGEFFDLLLSSADLTNFASEELQKYQNDMTTERDIRNQIAYARDEGIAEGREEGREEERSSIAAKLKAQGFPIDAIAEATGLSKEQLEAL